MEINFDPIFKYPLAIFFLVGIFLVIFAIIGVILIPKLSQYRLDKWWARLSIGGIGGILIVFCFIVAAKSVNGPTTISSPAATATPTAMLAPPTATATPTATLAPPIDFFVTEIKLKSGKIIQSGQPYPLAESPLTITGTYTSQGSGTVWVFVQGDNGHYYLQKPQVQFGSTHQWTASNVITAVGTIKIEFVYVTPQEQQGFPGVIHGGSYDFNTLPPGSDVLTDISIQVIKG